MTFCKIRTAGFLALPLSLLVSAQIGEEKLSTGEPEGRIEQRKHYFEAPRLFPNNYVPATARWEGIRQVDAMIAAQKASKRQTASADGVEKWTFIGPQPLLPLATGQAVFSGTPFASGHISALAVDPRNGNVVYAGAVTGGVWKTTDGGENWVPLTDDQPALAIGALAIDPNNPDTIYAGTGEANSGFYGAGVLKSTDGGKTWLHIPGPFAGPLNAGTGSARFEALAVNPNDSRILIAAVFHSPASTRGGIYRSTDAGLTWSAVLTTAIASDIAWDSGNPAIAYAALRFSGTGTTTGIYKTTDFGATWAAANGTGSAVLPAANLFGRTKIAVAPSSPGTVYIGVQDASPGRSGFLLGLFRTTDGGTTWLRNSTAPDYCQPQCFYNNTLAVHPKNPNLVIAGGLYIYRTTNGGASWANIYRSSDGVAVHVDHHALAFTPDGSKLYNGNDGGMYSTPNPEAAVPRWADLNRTLGITQFYPGISFHPDNPNIGFGGTQDNGTLQYAGDLAWEMSFGGDGGYTAIDQAWPDLTYNTYVGISVQRSSKSGNYQSYRQLTNGFLPGERAAFISPFVMDPVNPQRLYHGAGRLYRSDDSAGRWNPISPDLGGEQTRGVVFTIAVSPQDSNIVYAGTTDGRVWLTVEANKGSGASWVNRTPGLPLRSMNSIAVDEINPQIVYVATSGYSGFGNDTAGHVFKSINGGETWMDVSGKLPNVPVNIVITDPDIPNTIYIGTDLGVFRSRTGGNEWEPLMDGLPRVICNDLRLHRKSRTLRVATYGRGMWDMMLPIVGASQQPQIASVTPASILPGQDTTVTVTGSNFTKDTELRWNGSPIATQLVNGGELRGVIQAALIPGSGRATIAAFTLAEGAGLSNLRNIEVGGAPVITDISLQGTVKGPLVAGSLGVITGQNLAPMTTSVESPLGASLGGVSVEAGTGYVPILSVSPTKIVFQLPWGYLGYTRADIAVVNGTRATPLTQVEVRNYAPALQTMNGVGSGQGDIKIQGSATIAAPVGAFPDARPARKGETIAIRASGLGSVSLPPGSGTTPVAATPNLTRIPVVTIGGKNAPVLFSGLADGTIGEYVVRVLVPQDAPSGAAVDLQLTIVGVPSNKVTLAVE
jgi:uncharacterized protein (TIGR03437 family)